jgi:hypothetical protein
MRRLNYIMATIAIVFMGENISLFADSGYSTDFSTDPGWTTDQPTNFYWDSATQTYRLRVENNAPTHQPNRYTYHSVPSVAGSFGLQWDMKLTQDQWSSGINFGLFDSNLKVLSAGSGEQAIAGFFARSDQGLTAYLQANGASGGLASQNVWNVWSLDTWYTFNVTYDAETHEADFSVTERETGTIKAAKSIVVPGGFTHELSYLGTSWYGFGDTGYSGVNQWAVDIGYVDNVVLTPEPATLSLLALGGLALLRRKSGYGG